MQWEANSYMQPPPVFFLPRQLALNLSTPWPIHFRTEILNLTNHPGIQQFFHFHENFVETIHIAYLVHKVLSFKIVLRTSCPQPVSMQMVFQ